MNAADRMMFLAVATTALAAVPIGAQADPPPSTVTVKVRVADLNPYTTEGGRRLYSRIERAAYAACGASASDLEAIMMARGSCVKDAVGHAVQRLKIPSLARAYIKRNGFETAQEFGITTDVLIARR